MQEYNPYFHKRVSKTIIIVSKRMFALAILKKMFASVIQSEEKIAFWRDIVTWEDSEVKMSL
jgi:hypothetical protein